MKWSVLGQRWYVQYFKQIPGQWRKYSGIKTGWPSWFWYILFEKQLNDDNGFAKVVNGDKEEMNESSLLTLLEEYENENIHNKAKVNGNGGCYWTIVFALEIECKFSIVFQNCEVG